ncbi:MAG: protein-glutamate O-methyltransferase CheR [Bacteriovoracaceae bacterium]
MSALPKFKPEIKQELEYSDFEFFQRLIFSIAGINISPQKKELIRSRISKRVKSLGLGGYSEYRSYLESIPKRHEEWTHFTNALTTNKTEWFREKGHFDYLKEKVIPLLSQRGQKVKVWCAASSTGEEAYTLAFLLESHLKGKDYEIHASDIDTEALCKAQNGVYRKGLALAQTPKEYLSFFDNGREEIQEWVRVNKKIKEKIKFFQKNLLEAPERKNMYDIVFCRNVLIYFETPTITKIIENLRQSSKKDALLFVGHSESLQNVQTEYKYKGSSIYIKGKYFASNL